MESSRRQRSYQNVARRNKRKDQPKEVEIRHLNWQSEIFYVERYPINEMVLQLPRQMRGEEFLEERIDARTVGRVYGKPGRDKMELTHIKRVKKMVKEIGGDPTHGIVLFFPKSTDLLLGGGSHLREGSHQVAVYTFHKSKKSFVVTWVGFQSESVAAETVEDMYVHKSDAKTDEKVYALAERLLRQGFAT